MTSPFERGAYGRTRKVRDWSKYNPMGLKIEPFKEEKVCGLCESKCDVIFPMAPKLCGRCAMHAVGRQDVLNKWKFGNLDMAGYRCDNCGNNTYRPMIVNTRVCNRCTIKLGNQTKRNQIAKAYGARRVV